VRTIASTVMAISRSGRDDTNRIGRDIYLMEVARESGKRYASEKFPMSRVSDHAVLEHLPSAWRGSMQTCVPGDGARCADVTP